MELSDEFIPGTAYSSESSDGGRGLIRTSKSEKFAEYEQGLVEEVEEQFEKEFSFHRPGEDAWNWPAVKRVFANIKMVSTPPVFSTRTSAPNAKNLASHR